MREITANTDYPGYLLKCNEELLLDSGKKIKDFQPTLIWLESPTNPLLKILDIKLICDEANKHKIPVVLDNTFTTALIQKPLELGATLSLISTTKFINGHSDALGGAVLTNDEEWNSKMILSQKASLSCDLFIAIGSSLQVYPAVGFPILAKKNGSKLVILNREKTDLDGYADLVINEEIGGFLSENINFINSFDLLNICLII